MRRRTCLGRPSRLAQLYLEQVSLWDTRDELVSRRSTDILIFVQKLIFTKPVSCQFVSITGEADVYPFRPLYKVLTEDPTPDLDIKKLAAVEAHFKRCIITQRAAGDVFVPRGDKMSVNPVNEASKKEALLPAITTYACIDHLLDAITHASSRNVS